jgi:signal transduction histidine kinase
MLYLSQMKKILVLCALFILHSLCYGQYISIKKLQKQLPSIHDSLQYVDALNRLGMLSYESNIDSSFYYTEKARNISDRLGYASGQAGAANNLGVIYDIRGNLQLALRYYNSAYNRYVALNDTGNIVQAFMNIAMVYKENGQDEKSLKSYQMAFDEGAKLSRDSIMSLVWYNYTEQFPEKINKDSIPVYINRAQQIAKKYKDDRVLNGIDQLTADYLIRNNQRDKGITILQQAYVKAIQNQLYYLSLDILVDLGDLFIKTDSAKAIKYYNQGLNITVQKGYKIYSEVFARKLYDFYIAQKDLSKAFYFSRELLELHDEQERIDNSSSIDYIQYALKDQQLESARIHSKYQLMLLSLALLISIITIVGIIVLWSNWKKLRRTSDALSLQFKQSEVTTEALETMNKDYARLIKIVAHDLRNPIAGINSITNIVRMDNTLSPELEEMIGLIEVSSQNCMELINELLKTDFDQQQNFNPEPINIDELLEQCIHLLSFRAKDKNQQLILNTNLDVNITADKEKLWRVLNNLIINAIKFSPEDSDIEIETQKYPDKIDILVKDKGVGIPQSLQSKIFDPFTTARREGTQGEQPFGLGLYISKQIIEAHNGKIWLESEPEQGTTFHVELPLDK